MSTDFDRSAVVETICERLAQGEALSAICGSDGLPTTRTWLRWCDADETVAEEYSRALAARAEYYAAEHDRIRQTAVDRESAAAARVQLQGLEWQMQRAAPKRYGDRVGVDVGVNIDLSGLLEKRRQKVLEANARLDIAGSERDE
jgi:hypothetical protein